MCWELSQMGLQAQRPPSLHWGALRRRQILTCWRPVAHQPGHAAVYFSILPLAKERKAPLSETKASILIKPRPLFWNFLYWKNTSFDFYLLVLVSGTTTTKIWPPPPYPAGRTVLFEWSKALSADLRTNKLFSYCLLNLSGSTFWKWSHCSAHFVPVGGLKEFKEMTDTHSIWKWEPTPPLVWVTQAQLSSVSQMVNVNLRVRLLGLRRAHLVKCLLAMFISFLC